MQQVWRKRWRLTGWIALGAVTLVLLVSAIQKKNHKVCSGIEISFNEDGNTFFVDEKEILSVLRSDGSLKGVAIENIDLKALENRLKTDRWIAAAELFFDNKQVLQVSIQEKEPVARIFTTDGNSFYIDSACKRLPLSDKLSARIPMFTNFPSSRTMLSRPDSQLLASAKELAIFIQGDEFWKAQVAQVDITPSGFEMIPTVGNHIVSLGKDGDWNQKFDRLFSFYKQVWTQVGLERYEKIDVQFDKQVVATVKGAKPARVDSAKARLVYENILSEVKKQVTDTTAIIIKPIEKAIVNKPVVAKATITATTSRDNDKVIVAGNKDPLKTNTSGKVAKQSQAGSKAGPAEKQRLNQVVTKALIQKQETEEKTPKAVMKKPAKQKAH